MLETLAEVKQKVAVVPAVEWARFSHSFAHIFAGVTAQATTATCGQKYCLPMHSHVLKKKASSIKTTGQSFLNNILEMGGSEEPMELFKRFRGREPQN